MRCVGILIHLNFFSEYKMNYCNHQPKREVSASQIKMAIKALNWRYFWSRDQVTSLQQKMLVCTQTLLVFVGPWQGGQKVGRSPAGFFLCVFRLCFVKRCRNNAAARTAGPRLNKKTVGEVPRSFFLLAPSTRFFRFTSVHPSLGAE